MPGVKGKSGRKPSPTLNMKRAIEALSCRLPELIAKLEHMAMGEPVTCPHCKKTLNVTKPNSDDLKYLIDHIIGRAPQSIDHRIKSLNLSITPDELELATRKGCDFEAKLFGDNGNGQKLLEANANHANGDNIT